MGGIVDDILNPAYTSSIGLLMYNKDNIGKKGVNSGIKKPKISINGIVNKIKGLLEPILP